MRLLAALILLSGDALAQQKSAPPPQKQDQSKAMRALQDSIEQMRRKRLELEAAAERSLANDISDRAKRLAMGGEVGALQKLELLLDSAQARLLLQRDRIRVLKDASTRTEQAVLVVTLRAEALPAGEVAAVVWLDGSQVKTVTFRPDQRGAVLASTGSELYRAEIAPLAHKVLVQVAARGLSAGESVEIPSAPRQATHVEFLLKGGRLVPTTWTNKTTAF